MITPAQIDRLLLGEITPAEALALLGADDLVVAIYERLRAGDPVECCGRHMAIISSRRLSIETRQQRLKCRKCGRRLNRFVPRVALRSA